MIILITLFFCHFLADYTHLSTNWMLNAKRFGKPIFPILVHAGVHALLMGISLLLFHVRTIKIIDACLLQLASHFIIDLTKGKMNVWFPSLQSPTNKWHWIVFGADQFLHAMIIIVMFYIVNSALI
jgi:hypothetical protein